MRLLFVTPRFPYPPLKGDKVRAYYPIRALSRRHEIDLLALDEDAVGAAQRGEMEKYCRRIEVVRIGRPGFTLRLGIAILTPLPSQVFCYRSRKAARLVRALQEKDRYDVIVAVCARVLPVVAGVKGVPIVLDWIDALSLSTRRMQETARSWPMRMLYGWEARKMAAFERKHLRSCSASIVTSRVDQGCLGGEEIEVIPNGVDCGVFKPLAVEKDIDLVFTGNMGYFPNIQAVDSFCARIVPLLRRAGVKFSFAVVGANPTPATMRWARLPEVRVVGFVEDMSRYLNRSRVYVAPLRSGAGIQNKILEAMACGLPVVTTSFGNAGLQGRDGEELLVRDDDASFAAAIELLLRDQSLRAALGARARALVESAFSWEGMADRLDAIFSRLAAH